MINRLRPRDEAEARRPRHLRHLNLERLLVAAIARSEPFTRAEMTEDSALSAPTVGALTVQLIRAGLLRHVGTGPSRGGRRPSFMEFNARYGVVAGVAVSPTKIRIALADLRGERLIARSWAMPAGLPPVALLGKCAAWMKGLMSEAGIVPEKLIAVGASLAGTVDHDKGIVLAAPNLKGWENVPMAEALGSELGGVPVVVETDTNLAILGEHWRGAAVGHNTCALVYVGTGIGAGILFNGELHRGDHSLAGKIGMMCMGPQYYEQDFGPFGCLESLASLKTMRARWGAGTEGAPGDKRVDEIFQAAQNGDAKAKGLIAETARLVGIAATHITLVIDPSLVVVAGPLAEQEMFLAEVRQVVKRLIPAAPEIVPAKLGTDGPLVGSLLLATMRARSVLRQHLRA
jgi:glucokinase